MVTNPHIAEAMHKTTGLAARPIIMPEKREDAERAELLAKIKSQIDWLEFGPQSDAIKEMIRELQGLSSQLKSGVLPLSSARTSFSKIELEARTEVASARMQESMQIIRGLSILQQAEIDYKSLSSHARARVDTVYDLLRNNTHLTHQQQLTLVENLGGMDEYAGTAYGHTIANNVLQLKPNLAAEIQNTSPEAVRIAQTNLEKDKQTIDARVKNEKDQETKEHLHVSARLGIPDGHGCLAGKFSKCKTRAQAEQLHQEVLEEAVGHVRHHYAAYMKHASAEERAAIQQMGGPRAAVLRVDYLYSTEGKARLAAAERYNKGDRSNATAEVIADAAALEMVMTVRATEYAEVVVAEAKQIQKKIESGLELTQDERKMVDSATTYEEKVQITFRPTETRQLKITEEHNAKRHAQEVVEGKACTLRPISDLDKQIMNSVAKELNTRYANMEAMSKATDDEIHVISRAAVKSAGSMMFDNAFNTNKEITQKVANAYAKEAYDEAIKNKATKEQAEAAARDAKGDAIFGANVKNTGIHAAKMVGAVIAKDGAGIALNAMQMAESASAAAGQVTQKVGAMVDSATSWMGLETFDNQLANNMDALNKDAALMKLTGGKVISQKHMAELLEKYGYDELSEIDVNHDKKYTKSDYVTVLEKIGKKIDVENEKMIQSNLKEFANTIVRGKDGKKHGVFDTDGDYKVTVTEIMQSLKKAGVNIASYAGEDHVLSDEETQKMMKDAAKILEKQYSGDQKAPGSPPATPNKPQQSHGKQNG